MDRCLQQSMSADRIHSVRDSRVATRDSQWLPLLASVSSEAAIDQSTLNSLLASIRMLSVLFVLLTSLCGMCDSTFASDDSKKDDADSTSVIDQARDADGEVSLIKYPDMVLPSAEELLRAKPFDWIVLKTSDVLVVEPVGPRPDTLTILNNEYERYLKGRAGFTEGVDKLKERRRQLQRISLTLVDPGADQDPDYVLETKQVQKIDYFEDIVLRRANLLIDEGNIPLTYNLLLLVDRRHRENNLRLTEIFQSIKRDDAMAAAAEERVRYTVPEPLPLKLTKSWPRFDETYQRMLFTDAGLRSTRGDDEGSLRLLEDLWDRNAAYPELADRFGRVIDQVVSRFVQESDYRQARFFIGRLTARDPQHAVALKWRTELAARTESMIAEARNATSQGDASLGASLIDRAARIWPETPGLREAHRELNDRFQSVRLGVLRLPDDAKSYPFDAASESDERNLTWQPLFEPVRVDERGVRYRSTLLESWEPLDLGRQVQFTLRLKRADWEARPLITSADIQHEIAAKIDPTSPVYDERFAGTVERVEVQSPSEFTIFFRRLPLRLEALFQFPISLADPRALNPDLPPAALAHAGRQKFYEDQRDERQVVYRRVRSQPTTTKSRNIDEIVQIRYDSWDRGLQGLLRGEVVGLPHVDLKDVKGLQDDNRFFVVPYALPVSHLIVFNPRSLPLRDGQLRRSLTLALPREELLAKSIVAESDRKYARLMATPFPSNSYGHNRLLQEPPYDPQRAAALAMTARKQLGGDALPVLRLVCSPEPVVRKAAVEMIEHWRRVGITVQLVDSGNSLRDDDWDVAYRSMRIIEPLTELWPLLTVQSGTGIETLRPLPDRVRRQLLELERVNDWTSAKNLLHRIESELLVETRFIPLWEIDDFFVTRRNLIGLPPRLMHAFHDVERWTLQSWYPQESP